MTGDQLSGNTLPRYCRKGRTYDAIDALPFCNAMQRTLYSV